MLKKVIFGVLLVIITLAAWGCPSARTETSSAPANVKTIRETKISPNWAMKQLELNLEGEAKIWLTLSTGDKVDGYFYLIDGDNVSFSVSGTSLIYESKDPTTAEKSVVSDRFSFTVSQAQGLTYTLTFKTTGEEPSATVFIELIYPASGEILMPIGNN